MHTLALKRRRARARCTTPGYLHIHYTKTSRTMLPKCPKMFRPDFGVRGCSVVVCRCCAWPFLVRLHLSIQRTIELLVAAPTGCVIRTSAYGLFSFHTEFKLKRSNGRRSKVLIAPEHTPRAKNTRYREKELLGLAACCVSHFLVQVTIIKPVHSIYCHSHAQSMKTSRYYHMHFPLRLYEPSKRHATRMN